MVYDIEENYFQSTERSRIKEVAKDAGGHVTVVKKKPWLGVRKRTTAPKTPEKAEGRANYFQKDLFFAHLSFDLEVGRNCRTLCSNIEFSNSLVTTKSHLLSWLN